MTNLIHFIIIGFLSIFAYKFVFKRKNLKNVLPNKVVLITGASSGIGEALAHVFYVAGCRLILSARRKDELERVRKELLELYSTAVTHPPVVLSLDLVDINSLSHKAKQAVGIHGHIDILINNGGISFFGDVVTSKFESIMKVMMTNYFGTVELTKEVLPSMINRKEGRIVCVSSALGKFGIPYRAPYCSSKHALQGFCDSLRAEVAEHNVKVTLISPGYVITDVDVNAMTPTGKKYNKEDLNVRTGVTAMEMANDILLAVLDDKKDVMICAFFIRAAAWLRAVCPSIFFKIMEKLSSDFKPKE